VPDIRQFLVGCHAVENPINAVDLILRQAPECRAMANKVDGSVDLNQFVTPLAWL
jgi:hypothetical protein